MNIKTAKEEIKNSVKAYLDKDEYGEYKIPQLRQRPILLIGPPGIGKTQIMEQIAKECEIGLVAYTITHHTRQRSVGLPFIEEKVFNGTSYSITEYTMSEIIASVYQTMEDTHLQEGILFIDEINCVSETLAPTMLQFLQKKTFGNQSIPNGWVIVAAGNPPEYNKSVREFDMVTLDRVRYLNVEADYYVWKQYAIDQHIHPAILSYLELKPSSFYKVESDVDGMKFVTARGWEDLSHLMYTYESLQIPVTQEVVQEYIHHEDVAEDVASYFTLYKKYEDDYGISNILKGRVNSTIYARVFEASFDERLAVVNLVLDGIQKELRIYDAQKNVVNQWYSFLKGYRNRMKETDNYKDTYMECIQEWVEDLEFRKQAQLIYTNEYNVQNHLIQQIKNAGNELDASMSDKESFQCVRSAFDVQREKMEEMEENLEQIFNHSFTFMEEAFHTGQEMVVFVTGCSMNSLASLFLSEHDIPLYETYKEQLLIGTRKQDLLDLLEH